MSHHGRSYGMMMTNFSKVVNSVLSGARYIAITTLVYMTFYQVNDDFVFGRNVALHASSKEVLTLPPLSKRSTKLAT